ncbi:putative reverse transcriptase domain-containing protein [Tanacetum coccineum]
MSSLMLIMSPRMTTQSAGQATVAPRGGRTGGGTGRGGDRTRGRYSDQGNGRIDGQGGQNLLPTILAQVGSQGNNQGDDRNQKGNVVNDNRRGNFRNVIMNNGQGGCSYKEFLACNPKDYDGKGDFKTLMREEFCLCNEMQKLETELWNHAMAGAGHAAYTNRFHELARSPRMVVAIEPTTIQKAVQIAGTLTDEAIRNGSIKKNPEKRGNGGEPSKDRNERDDNKRTRTGNSFATTTNIVRRENTGTTPKCTTCNFYHPPEAPCRTCFNCNRPGNLAKDCRVMPRNVKPVNARNPTAAHGASFECGAIDGGQGRGKNGNQARGKAFLLGAEEARQDLNIMTGMFTLNNRHATTLFDSGADYTFVSTTFIPLLGIEPSDLGFSYEIEIASGQLVEINKVIKGCKLEIDGHVFDINLIPIPLLDGKVLGVLGERLEEKARHLMSVKAKEQKQEEMVVVRDFPKVFPDDLSGLPPIREIEFQIELVPGAILVMKSPYRLTPSEMEELSGQLKECHTP